MQRTNRNVFLRANIRFQGVANNIVSCNNVGKLDFSSWRALETQGPNETPDPETSTSAPSTETVERVEFGCKLTKGRRNGLIECGRAGDWTDSTLDDLDEHIKNRGGSNTRKESADCELGDKGCSTHIYPRKQQGDGSGQVKKGDLPLRKPPGARRFQNWPEYVHERYNLRE